MAASDLADQGLDQYLAALASLCLSSAACLIESEGERATKDSEGETAFMNCIKVLQNLKAN